MKLPLSIAVLTVFSGAYLASSAKADVIYADTLVASQNVTLFNSGVLTGAPDSGGAYLSNTSDPPTNLGFVILGFSGGLIDGAGADLRVFDCCVVNGVSDSNEFFNVLVSNNNIGYTLIGGFGNGVNDIDIAGLFVGPFSYVKIVNTSTANSPDIDAVRGNYGAAAVPEPATLPLLGLVLTAAYFMRRKFVH